MGTRNLLRVRFLSVFLTFGHAKVIRKCSRQNALPMLNPSICIDTGFDFVENLILNFLIRSNMLKFRCIGMLSMMSVYVRKLTMLILKSNRHNANCSMPQIKYGISQMHTTNSKKYHVRKIMIINNFWSVVSTPL